jgi:hypothetical protein
MQPRSCGPLVDLYAKSKNALTSSPLMSRFRFFCSSDSSFCLICNGLFDPQATQFLYKLQCCFSVLGVPDLTESFMQLELHVSEFARHSTSTIRAFDGIFSAKRRVGTSRLGCGALPSLLRLGNVEQCIKVSARATRVSTDLLALSIDRSGSTCRHLGSRIECAKRREATLRFGGRTRVYVGLSPFSNHK